MLAEKYRPRSLDEVIGQRRIVTILRGYVAKKEMPNLLFCGKVINPTSLNIGTPQKVFMPISKQEFECCRTRMSKVRMLTDVEAAYLAGVLDCDGTISVFVQPSGICPYIAISSARHGKAKQFVEHFLKIIGAGNVRLSARAHGTWNETWQYRLTGLRNVYAVLKQVAPFLVLKKEQAQLLISYCESRLSKTGGPTTKKYTDHEKKLIERIRLLNKRGR